MQVIQPNLTLITQTYPHWLRKGLQPGLKCAQTYQHGTSVTSDQESICDTASGRRGEATLTRVAASVSWNDGEERIQVEAIHSIQLKKKKNSIKFKIYFFSLNFFFFFNHSSGDTPGRGTHGQPCPLLPFSQVSLAQTGERLILPRTLIPLSYKAVGERQISPSPPLSGTEGEKLYLEIYICAYIYILYIYIYVCL